MRECIGCGYTIWTPKNENESGEWCTTGGTCEITDFEGVNRLREAYLANVRATCAHEYESTRDGLVSICKKCHQHKPHEAHEKH